MSLALSGDTIAYMMTLGLDAEQMKGLVDRLNRDAVAMTPPAQTNGINEERERLRNESTYAERKRAKDRARRASEREELRRLKAEREATATTPATTRDSTGEASSTEGTNGDPALAPTHVEYLTSSLRSEDIPPATPKGVSAPKGAEASRGTRLPDGWRPDDEGLAYAIEALGPNVDPERELDRFRDYWRAIPGAKGRKTDWPATWRNWVRRAAETLPRKAHERPDPNAKLLAKNANYERAWTGSERAFGRDREP